jgi:hypothetical protein
MTTSKKIILGLSVAGGALLAAWLLTGDRKQKTKEFVSKKAEDLKQALKKDKPASEEESDVHYV